MFKGHKHTQQTKSKMSKMRQGIKFTQQHIENLSKSHLGKTLSDNAKIKLSKFNKGKKLSKQHKKKISLAKKGVEFTEEHKKKLSIAQKKNPNRYWEGRQTSKQHKQRISQTLQGAYAGDKAAAWQGGKSSELYTVDWTKTLRRSIRERDKYRCQLCGEPQGDQALCVHHIDYNKKNCNLNNLVTLCRSCHGKTQIRRIHWTKYFKTFIL